MKALKRLELWQQVVIGLILGVITGYFLREKTEYLKPLGTVFINLIKMVIVPLIFFSIVSGITDMKNTENVSRVATKSVIAFLLTSIFAVTIGLVFAAIFEPGKGNSFNFLNIPHKQVIQEFPSISEMLINIIPTNAFAAMVEGNVLQIILFSFFTGITLNILGDKAKEVKKLTHELAQVSFKMIEIVVKLAPIGVFGYMSWSIGTQGFDIVISLGKLVLTIIAACIIQYLVFGLFILIFARINPLPFYSKMIEPQLLALSTSSSKATLTTTMRVLHEKLGVSKNSTNFVLPIGSSINMDGGAIYLGVCAVFFAQATGLILQPYHYGILVLMCTLGSIGAAGIPSGIMLFLGMTLSSIGLPIEAVAIVAGVDRILDMITTAVNVTGDACVTLIIDKTENQLDKDVYSG
jgi:Na+/H+-dicarboxylate symporter